MTWAEEKDRRDRSWNGHAEDEGQGLGLVVSAQ